MAIRTGLIGAGYWGQNLERVLEESPQFKLLCVADSAADRGNCSVEDLLARTDVDAVVIATPASTHGVLVAEALLHDKHVLVEKPLALNYEDAAFCVELADEKRLQLMVDHTYVYGPGLAAVRGALVGLGEIKTLFSTRTHRGGPRDVNSIWDLLPHDLSISQALTPQWWDTPPSIQSIGDAEEGVVWFGWGGQRCIVEYSRRSPDKTRRVDITTIDGVKLRWIDHPTPRVFIERPDHDEVEEVPVAEGESLRTMIDAFAASIMTVKPSPSSGRRALPLIEAIERANEEVA